MAQSVKVRESDRGLPRVERPELFVGLVGAVGTNLQNVVDLLKKKFAEFGYQVHEIRLSQILRRAGYAHLNRLKDGPEDVRINKHMSSGDDLRSRTKRGDTLAALSLFEIQRLRAIKTSDVHHPAYGNVYVLNSFKHPHEIDTLRQIYGKAFSVISVYEPRARRIENLCRTIAKSRNVTDKERFRTISDGLAALDQHSGKNKYGQNVRETFPKADFFIKTTGSEHLDTEIDRFVSLLFGFPFHTPYREEMGMFFAKAASLRSSDLSRQVGAVICDRDGETLAVGCNEVPKAMGGSVWAGEKPDYRDFQLGYDSSAIMKEEIVAEVFKSLRDNRWLSAKIQKFQPQELAEKVLYGDAASIFADTRVTSLIEYGRMVHAEMGALMDAVRRGVSVRGATLYCTTFPCHMCARHLLSAGIERVVFIEPYPKSMAKDLYQGSIRVDEGDADPDALKFESFVGVAPRRFLDWFEMPQRKNERGKVVNWNTSSALPRIERLNDSYLVAEDAVSISIAKLVRSKTLGGTAHKKQGVRHGRKMARKTALRSTKKGGPVTRMAATGTKN